MPIMSSIEHYPAMTDSESRSVSSASAQRAEAAHRSTTPGNARAAGAAGRANRRSGVIAGLAALLAACFVPCTVQASLIGTVTADGYTFVNFDGTNAGTNAGTGTNMNGISNGGSAVGVAIDNNGSFSNFVFNPNRTFTSLSLGGTNTMAFGINSQGDVVGQQNGAAFFLPFGGSAQMLSIPGSSGSSAFGINDHGNIVGQYVNANGTPGFFVSGKSGNGLVSINAPSGPNTVNAQGINDNGQITGFYVGTDGQDHGFLANIANAQNGNLTGTPIADPTIPAVAGEPGATFIFSQVLGINDSGIAVGYYGDSTTSQHGFIYNTHTGAYTFLDNPSTQFNNGVEVTQITGINNANDITGFYSDAAGVFHGFVACPAGAVCPASNPLVTPEPGYLLPASFGVIALGFSYKRRQRSKRAGAVS